MTEHEVAFSGELQVIAWSDGSSGAWVKMWIHPDDVESFKAMRCRKGNVPGTRLGTVMVVINDDESVGSPPPVPESRTYVTTFVTAGGEEIGPPGWTPPPVGAMGMLAVRWCRDPEFQAWAADQIGVTHFDEGQCKDFILEQCGVYEKYGTKEASRKHLDTDEECGESFQLLVRIPFMKHMVARGIAR